MDWDNRHCPKFLSQLLEKSNISLPLYAVTFRGKADAADLLKAHSILALNVRIHKAAWCWPRHVGRRHTRHFGLLASQIMVGPHFTLLYEHRQDIWYYQEVLDFLPSQKLALRSVSLIYSPLERFSAYINPAEKSHPSKRRGEVFGTDEDPRRCPNRRWVLQSTFVNANVATTRYLPAVTAPQLQQNALT